MKPYSVTAKEIALTRVNLQFDLFIFELLTFSPTFLYKPSSQLLNGISGSESQFLVKSFTSKTHTSGDLCNFHFF